jgi:hypothetical protein
MKYKKKLKKLKKKKKNHNETFYIFFKLHASIINLIDN